MHFLHKTIFKSHIQQTIIIMCSIPKSSHGNYVNKEGLNLSKLIKGDNLHNPFQYIQRWELTYLKLAKNLGVHISSQHPVRPDLFQRKSDIHRSVKAKFSIMI